MDLGSDPMDLDPGSSEIIDPTKAVYQVNSSGGLFTFAQLTKLTPKVVHPHGSGGRTQYNIRAFPGIATT